MVDQWMLPIFSFASAVTGTLGFRLALGRRPQGRELSTDMGQGANLQGDEPQVDSQVDGSQDMAGC